MKIEVLIDSWMKYLRVNEGSLILDLVEGITTNQILSNLEISQEEIGIITFNDHLIQLDTPIIDDGKIRFYPNIIGG